MTPEVITSMAWLAARTRGVVGAAALLLPLYAPGLLAKQVAELDRLTGGRTILGVGVGGEFQEDFRAVQVQPSERGARVDEAIPLLRRLWTTQPVDHAGPYFPMRDVRIHPGPGRPGGPPVVVAGRQSPAIRRAARLGDGWMPYLYSPRRFAASMRELEEVAASQGRSLDAFARMVWMVTSLSDNREDARAEAASRSPGGVTDASLDLVDHTGAAGAVDQVADRLCGLFGSRRGVGVEGIPGAAQGFCESDGS